ncbi:MAG: hypothetical protein M0R77_13275 [Gammaproteobacteria bacterium]|nr:hypothetical protein [Gammaproteobacteria bacterium]
MNTARLSLSQTPPLTVPAPYLLAAPWFVVAAGLWLAVAPDAFADRWSSVLLGVTHLITLGFLAMAMLGAFQQLLPVLLGVPLGRPRALAWSVFLPLALGTLLLATGLGLAQKGLLLGALGLLGAALGVFLWRGGRALLRAPTVPGTTPAMRAALLALAVTITLGLHLAGGHAGGSVARQLTDVHLAWGLVGWVVLLVAGVAYQVVPMFQITPEYPRALMRWLVPVLLGALVSWSVARALIPAWAAAPAWLAALALVAFAVITLRLQMRRRRSLPDVTVEFWRLGMLCLLGAVALWLARPWIVGYDVLVGVLFVAGFAMSVVSGMLYKILPFLVWLHLNNRLHEHPPGQRGRIPTMKQIIGEASARRQYRAHALAVALLCAASVWPVVVRPAGLALALSGVLLGVNLADAIGVYRRTRAGTHPVPLG